MKVTNRTAEGVRIVDRIDVLFDRRFAGAPAWVALLELFLGMGWLRASAEKVANSRWWSGAELESFVAEHQSATLGWYEPFLTNVVLPNSELVAAVVLGAEVVAGVAFIVARPRWLGPVISILLAMNFLAAGSPNPSVFYLMLTLALALWWLEERADVHRSTLIFRLMIFGSIPIFAVTTLSITTLEPSRMVEDPALVMCSFVGCTCVAAAVALRAEVPVHVHAPGTEYELIDLGNSPLSEAPLSEIPLSEAPLSEIPLSDSAAGPLASSNRGLSDAGLSDVGRLNPGLSNRGLSDAGLSDVGRLNPGLSDAGLSDAGLSRAQLPER